jgi:hypothetical protein
VTRRADGTPWNNPLALLVAVLVLGGAGFELGSGHRAALSFAGALLVGAAFFAGGAAGIRAAGRLAPLAAMMTAVAAYIMTVLLLAIAYVVASPAALDFTGVGVGLICAVLVWTVVSIRALTAGVNDA